MGEVFLAEDTRLGRKVALKLLPEGLLSDPEIRRRFSQEARAVSALNHPQIVTIYDVGSADQRDFIAMEYVDGETLRGVLAAGPIEVRRAFDLVAQAAAGLAAAHEAGVVHRDVKPENLMVTRNGQVKIMDFGLAKLVERQIAPLLESGLATAAQTPLPTSHGTATGVILGTVSYMSPEQAQGRPVDHRTDIFSLGLVLYEALTGSRPFSGKSAVETLHAIINEEPLSASQRNPSVPPEATEILGKALAKDPAERYQHAADFALDLRRAKRAVESGISRPAVRVSAAPASRPRPILWAGIALAVAALAAGAWYLGRSGARPRGSDLADVTLTPLTSEPGYEGEPTFSPDGETIAYVSNRTGNFEIFLKQVSGGPDVNVTNNPADDAQPAFSPDGKQIAFVSTRESRTPLVYENFGVPPTGGDIWVMPALGGSPRRIAEAGNFPSWSPDGSSLVFMSGGAFKKKIFRVPATGGESREIPIRPPGGEGVFRYILYPTLSPDGKWILFQVEQFRVHVVPSSGGEAKLLCRGRRPVWAPDGRSVVYSNADPGRNFSLWRIPFSSAKGAADGPAEPVTVGRGVDTQATISHDGRQIAFTALEQTFNLEVLPFDAELGEVTGEVKVLTSGNNDIEWKSLSPDGRSVAYENAGRVWRLDPGQAAYPLTSDAAFSDDQPRWSPDGQSILFERTPAGEPRKFEVWLMAADGGGPRQLVGQPRDHLLLDVRLLPVPPRSRDAALPPGDRRGDAGAAPHREQRRQVDRLPIVGPELHHDSRASDRWRGDARGRLDSGPDGERASDALALRELVLLPGGSQERVPAPGAVAGLAKGRASPGDELPGVRPLHRGSSPLDGREAAHLLPREDHGRPLAAEATETFRELSQASGSRDARGLTRSSSPTRSRSKCQREARRFPPDLRRGRSSRISEMLPSQAPDPASSRIRRALIRRTKSSSARSIVCE
jgi:Tol biopolymer transport system component